MRYDLATLIKRTTPGIRRRAIVIRDIAPPATLAGDLYASVYKPVVELWQRAGEGIAEEYARTLSAMTTDSPEDLQARLDAAGSEFERLMILLEAGLRDWSVRVERWQRGKWRGAVLSATGVDIGTLIGVGDVRDTLGQYIAWNVDLVRDVSAEVRRRISNAVFSGLTERKPARDVAREIREATGMARDRSLRIASDQLNKITSSLSDERRREAGLSVWKWRHSRKRHPRRYHQEREGVLYSDTPAIVGREVDGETVRAAPEAGDRPGQPPYCGCRAQGVLVLD